MNTLASLLLCQSLRNVMMKPEDHYKPLLPNFEKSLVAKGYKHLRACIYDLGPAPAVIAIWTFMGAWNDFQGPLIYINSPENMRLSYALALFKGDRSNKPGLLMAFSTLTVVPVIALFAFAQKYFIEGVTLSGLGGR